VPFCRLLILKYINNSKVRVMSICNNKVAVKILPVRLGRDRPRLRLCGSRQLEMVLVCIHCK
jgi:hypothetical protein